MNLDEFEKKLSQCRQLLIIVHNNPDPDAIASAEALRFLVENRSGVKVSIAYGGYIGRAENREMVRQLGIRLKQFNRIRLGNYDCIALVDTQPGAGNNSLPATVKCD